ncbi:MAG: Verru_Chthon cassette protein C [Verrucomicrobiales bacterium]|nr:Verru_Chthon cassette protein C [Verrucomicrobiales bacterium]MCP5558373.1 Verru_Chthon cassette protein C [Verrucomicrobiaceae bacterium]
MNLLPPDRPTADPRQRRAFTLLELMLAITIFTMIGVVITNAISGTQKAWTKAHATAREFREARNALDTISRNVARAELNQEWVTEDVADPLPSFSPERWMRDSDMHFVCGPTNQLIPQVNNATSHAVFFQLPAGFTGARAVSETQSSTTEPVYDTLYGALNGWGYYIEFGEDPRTLPDYLRNRPGAGGTSKKQRFRLIEFRQPSHEMTLFKMEPDGTEPLLKTYSSQEQLYTWFREPIKNSTNGKPEDRRTTVIAENILALVITPYQPPLDSQSVASATTYALAPNYLFDSRRFQWQPSDPLAQSARHTLPPTLRLTVVAMDEARWESFSDVESVQIGLALRDAISGLFSDPTRYEDDLKSIEEALEKRRIDYRILTSNISLPDPP